MATLLLMLVVVLVIGGLVFGVVSLLSGSDPGLVPAEPDGRARPLPNDRSLREEDLKEVRFEVVLRGYRMGQVDRMLRRTAYDLGYKDEMIAVLEAEVTALREGRVADADVLRDARESASSPADARPAAGQESEPATDGETDGEEPPQESARSADGPAPEPAMTDRTDDQPPDDEPDLPREGSLRRRDPVAADAVPAPDSTAAVDVADRPAHA